MNKNAIISRLLQMVIVLIGISFLTFLLTYLSPGDPARNKEQCLPCGGSATVKIVLPTKWDALMAEKGYVVQATTRQFNPARDYLWPIPAADRLINENLTQNPGY